MTISLLPAGKSFQAQSPRPSVLSFYRSNNAKFSLNRPINISKLPRSHRQASPIRVLSCQVSISERSGIWYHDHSCTVLGAPATHHWFPSSIVSEYISGISAIPRQSITYFQVFCKRRIELLPHKTKQFFLSLNSQHMHLRNVQALKRLTSVYHLALKYHPLFAMKILIATSIALF